MFARSWKVINNNRMEGSTKDGEKVTDDRVCDALQKTLQRGVFTGFTTGPKKKALNQSEYCLRPFVRRGNGNLKCEQTKCRCVHTVISSLDAEDPDGPQGPARKQVKELSVWFSEVERKATSRGGSWTIAATHIRECCVMGGGGTDASKVIMVNHGEEGGKVLGSNSSRMCLYSVWCALRIMFWDTKDNRKVVLGEAEEFQVAFLNILAERVKWDCAKMINRNLLSIYADNIVKSSTTLYAPIMLETFWDHVSEEMEVWRTTMGHQKKNWEDYFKNNGLARVVVCVPFGSRKCGPGPNNTPKLREDHRTAGIRKFCEKFPADARPRLVKLGHDSCLKQVMRWYRYGIHDKNWHPSQFRSARETKYLLRYAGTSGGLLNGLMGLREASSKTHVPPGHWATVEGREDLKKTAIADRCLQYVIDAAIRDDGSYDESTGEIAGCEEYLLDLQRQWRAREVETGCTPTAGWASSEFGNRSADTYTCDVGYLFTKNHHTVQKPHVDYQRRTQMMTNWIGFVPVTKSGMFIEVWPSRPKPEEIQAKIGGVMVDKRMPGSIVFVPYGIALLVRGDTVHAGGMHCDSFNNPYGNPRLHIYIKNKTQDVTNETNGNRWKDYDSDEVSDNDTPTDRFTRVYPLFTDKRKDAACMGFIDGDSQAKNKGVP